MKCKKISVDLTLESANNIKCLREHTGMSQSEIVDRLLHIFTPQVVLPLLNVAQDEESLFFDLLENRITVGLHPIHRGAKILTFKLYDSSTKIIEIFEYLFETYAAGIDFKAKYDNGFPFFKQFFEVVNTDVIIEKIPKIKNEIHYMKNQFDSIYGLIEYYASQNKNDFPNTLTKSDLFYVKKLYDEFELCRLGEILQVLEDYWYIVGNHTRTYRLLTALARQITDFNDTLTNRNNLRKAIIEASSEWN